MNIKYIKIYSFVTILLLFTSSAVASAETDFNQGVAFFRAGDYASAVLKFKAAAEQGINNVSLHYNLASSYYKLGNFQASKKHFNQVLLFENMQDLASYNLGLIALKQNNQDRARQYFNSIVQSGKDQKLVKLSRNQLSTVEKKADSLRVYLASNFGYSDNIDSTADGIAPGISDSFYDLFISLETVISGQRKDGWLAEAFLFSLDYLDTNLYDESQFLIGIKKEHKLSDWDTAIAIFLSKDSLAGEDYLSTLKLEIKARKSLEKNESLYFWYRYADIGSEDIAYDYLDGWRQRARVGYSNYSDGNMKQIYYELELNDRGDLIGIDDAYDYSATRHTLRGKYIHFMNRKLSLTGDVSYRFSFFPVSSTADRQDDRWKIALSTDYRINKTFKWVSKLQLINNVSSLERYNYENYIINLGLTKIF
ncbi:MAG: tetratricopeptide repeat protein [Gammaproteobacteria bacterium]|nr:tetratricopeptide repeat protein [Gammaproteobacteria bacterium]